MLIGPISDNALLQNPTTPSWFIWLSDNQCNFMITVEQPIESWDRNIRSSGYSETH
jgi:hypothetical protein